jgi:hypothetical protein
VGQGEKIGTGLGRGDRVLDWDMMKKYGPVTPKIKSCNARSMGEKKLPL